MAINIYETLHTEGLISDESLEKIKKNSAAPLFTLNWEIKTLLYLGVLFLTTGLGLLIYDNIDSIGHTFVLLIIALLSTACFVYCDRNKLPFSTAQVASPNASFDYILLLGSISMLSFATYLQYQYNVFGNHYGMATFIPMLALFFVAYYFDHIGILGMALASLALWMGVSITPKQLLLHSDFDSERLIYTYLLLGILLLVAGFVTQRTGVKKHFKFSYQHYGIHVAYIALLAGYFHFYNFPYAIIWLLGIALLSLFIYSDALKNRSFYFLMLMVFYCYISVSSLVIRMLSPVSGEGTLALIFMYFIASAIGLIFLLINLNKKLKHHGQL